MDTPPPSDRLPPSLAPFRLLAQLGRGGFAPVWLAEEVHDGRKLRDVALKLFLLPDEIPRGSSDAARWHDRILEEARALCRVEHPNVVRFYALHRNDAEGVVGLAMEYIAGKNLDVVLRERGTLDDLAVLEAGISVAWALAAVHQAGLVHRDIKPGNIIAWAKGYKLIDFGIVIDTPPSSRELGASVAGVVGSVPLVGTRGYIAPEYFMAGARPTPAGDLYALGATLFKLARGILPAPPEQPRSSHPRAWAPATPAAQIASLADMIALLLEPDRYVRPHHADWVARELERLRAELVPTSARRDESVWDVEVSPQQTTLIFQGSRDGQLRTTAQPDRPMPQLTGDADSTPRTPLLHPPLVGRSDTLATLPRFVHDASPRNVRFVLLTGPLGIGRTRLLGAAVERAGAAAERVLRVSCSPERQSPLRPLLRALEALPEGSSDTFGQVIDAIDRALVPAVLPGGQGDEALEAIEDALLWAARDEPVVLAVDDIQWGDTHTIKLLQLFVERAEMGSNAHLIVFVAARDEPNPSPPLRKLLSRVRSRSHPAVQHVALDPLSAGDAAALARAVCPIDPALARAVVRDSGRVPFFVVHALRAWCERGAITWYAGAWHAVDERILREDVPGVADLLEARLASFFETESTHFRTALRALAAVALYGDDLRVEILFQCAGCDAETLEIALETLAGADILVVEGDPQEYSFAQEMVRQAALTLLRQRPWFHRLHRALLDAVAASPGAQTDAAFLATGYEKLGAKEEARTWLGHAMQSARDAGLFDEAVTYGDRLAALAPDPCIRLDVEIEVLRLLVYGRQFEDAKARVARIDARAQVFPCRDARSRVQDVQHRILSLQLARGCAEPADDPALAGDADALADPAFACEARIALAGVAKGERALVLADEAVLRAEQAGPVLEFLARELRAELIYAAPNRDLELAERDLRRALAIAVATSSIPQQIDMESDLAVLEAELGRLDDAIERLRRLVEQAEALGMRGQLRLTSHNLATCLLRAGRAAEAAEEAGRNADRAAQAGDLSLRGTALSLRSLALLQTGDFDGALVSVTEAERLQRARDDEMLAQTLLCRAEILWALGRFDDALEDAHTARQLAERHGDEGLRVTAVLAEKLYLARRGQATAEELRQALAMAEASGFASRALLRRLMDQAAEWLAGRV